MLVFGASTSDIVDAVYTYNVVTQHWDRPSALALLTRVIAPPGLGNSLPWLAATMVSLLAVPWLIRLCNRSAATTALPLLWLTGLLSYGIQARGLIYHLAPCFLAIAGLQAILLALVESGRVRVIGLTWKSGLTGGLAMIIALAVGYRMAAVYYSLPLALLTSDYSRHLARFPANNQITVADAIAFASRVQLAPRSDCLLVVGDVSALNFLTGVPQPTRFYYMQVLIKTRPPLPMASRWAELWDEDLAGADCHFALIPGRSDGADWVSGSSRVATALRRFLADYEASGTLGQNAGLIVYERK
jgi:hypothetical protein